MSSFWESDTRVAYEQTSIAIPAENGRQFSENNKIVILVPADVNFFQPSESYLQCRVMVSHPTATGLDPTRLQLDAELGGQVLIKNLRILMFCPCFVETTIFLSRVVETFLPNLSEKIRRKYCVSCILFNG